MSKRLVGFTRQQGAESGFRWPTFNHERSKTKLPIYGRSAMSENYCAQRSDQCTYALLINFQAHGILNGNNFYDDEYRGFLHMSNIVGCD